MKLNDERSAIQHITEQFLHRWMPQALTPREKSEFLMDLERLVLTRTLEIEGHGGTASGDAERFDWRDARRLAVKRAYALAVYKSADGDLVVRQQRSDGEEDTVVVIPLGSAASVIDAIQRQLREPGFPPVVSKRPER